LYGRELHKDKGQTQVAGLKVVDFKPLFIANSSQQHQQGQKSERKQRKAPLAYLV
jgi:hypothetical protein